MKLREDLFSFSPFFVFVHETTVAGFTDENKEKSDDDHNKQLGMLI